MASAHGNKHLKYMLVLSPLRNLQYEVSYDSCIFVSWLLAKVSPYKKFPD